MVVQSTDTHSCSGRTLKSIHGCLELLRDDELLSVLGFVQPPGAIAAWKKYVQPHAGRDGIDAWLWSECMFMYVTARASYQPEDELTVDYGPEYTRDYCTGAHRPNVNRKRREWDAGQSGGKQHKSLFVQMLASPVSASACHGFRRCWRAPFITYKLLAHVEERLLDVRFHWRGKPNRKWVVLDVMLVSQELTAFLIAEEVSTYLTAKLGTGCCCVGAEILDVSPQAKQQRRHPDHLFGPDKYVYVVVDLYGKLVDTLVEEQGELCAAHCPALLYDASHIHAGPAGASRSKLFLAFSNPALPEFNRITSQLLPTNLRAKSCPSLMSLAANKAAEEAAAAAHEAAAAAEVRAIHYSLRTAPFAPPVTAVNLRTANGRAKPLETMCLLEIVREPTGTTTYGFRLWQEDPSYRIATMVAANSGRPAGACGGVDRVLKIHAGHRTQEEDIMSNWMTTRCGDGDGEDVAAARDALYRATIAGVWGMVEPTGTSLTTHQGLDYVSICDGERAEDDTADAAIFGDAWVVCDAKLSVKHVGSDGWSSFDPQQTYPTALVFAAGPNAAEGSWTQRDPTSSMRRTYCYAAVRSYPFMRAAVSAALAAAFDAAVAVGCDVVLVAGLSTGLYAGPWHRRINDEFASIVEELLQQPLAGFTEARGKYLRKVVWVRL